MNSVADSSDRAIARWLLIVAALVFAMVVLGGMGSVAADRGAHARAARLWGAAEAVRESTGASVSPVEQQLLEGRQAAVREALGKTTLQADWAAGRRLGLEGATAEALASGSS